MYTPFRDTGSEAVTGGRYRTRHFGILGYVTARPDSIESFKMTKVYQGRVASIGNVKSPYSYAFMCIMESPQPTTSMSIQHDFKYQ